MGTEHSHRVVYRLHQYYDDDGEDDQKCKGAIAHGRMAEAVLNFGLYILYIRCGKLRTTSIVIGLTVGLKPPVVKYNACQLRSSYMTFIYVATAGPGLATINLGHELESMCRRRYMVC